MNREANHEWLARRIGEGSGAGAVPVEAELAEDDELDEAVAEARALDELLDEERSCRCRSKGSFSRSRREW
jgi:hypothetical protein